MVIREIREAVPVVRTTMMVLEVFMSAITTWATKEVKKDKTLNLVFQLLNLVFQLLYLFNRFERFENIVEIIPISRNKTCQANLFSDSVTTSD